MERRFENSMMAQLTPTSDTNPVIVKVQPPKCFCNRNLLLEDLSAIYTHQSKKVLERFLPILNNTMNKYEINTCIRKIHFLAQVGHESGELQYKAEILPKGKLESSVYDGYKGRGLIQLTWKANYEKYGKSINVDLLNNKSLLESDELACDSAGWFWRKGSALKEDLNGFADNNDLIYITMRINGGLNGYKHRLEILQLGAKTSKIETCVNAKSWNFKEFELVNSHAYNSANLCFCFGYWHDPVVPTRKGTDKDSQKSKIGYKFCLERDKEKPMKLNMYGLTPEARRNIAKMRG